ncbi:MAG TPA: chemotaxis protein CheW [Candidatus Omnitrophota bacterium]|nr:chemotaxis protein CheW [Candidatus Omnitrophota bacterium]
MKAVAFTLADKEYAVAVERIREVIRMRTITPIPDSAAFVEGVISLRGKVIPLINLRRKLGLAEAELARSNRIMITQCGKHPLGVIVDRITDVISLDETSIEAPDAVLKEAKYLIGLGKIGKRLILIADIGQLLSGEDQMKLEEVQGRVEIKKRT